MNKKYYIAIDRDFKGKSSGAGYNRLSIYKIDNYQLSKFYIEKILKYIFDYEYPNIIDLYSEKECRINYPLLITNDKRLFQTYRNVLNLEEFEIYCVGEDEKVFLINNHKKLPKINKYKSIAFQPFKLDEYAGSNIKILELVKELINSSKVGFKNFDPNIFNYDNSDDNYYETYNPDLLGTYKFIENRSILENLIDEYNSSFQNQKIFKENKTLKNNEVNESEIYLNNNPELLDD